MRGPGRQGKGAENVTHRKAHGIASSDAVRSLREVRGGVAFRKKLPSTNPKNDSQRAL